MRIELLILTLWTAASFPVAILLGKIMRLRFSE
jgi:hypothetical protein